MSIESTESAMKWKFQPAGTFDTVRETWDALNRSHTGHILLDSTFVAPLLRHFRGDKALLGVCQDPTPNGMVLLTRKRAGVWETFQPAQAPIGLIVLGATDLSQQRLPSLMRQLPGYAVQLSMLQQDPDYSSVPANNGSRAQETVEYIHTARITLNGTFEEYWKARGTNLRHNLARRRRRMTEKGYTLELVERRSPREMAEAIQEHGRLEETGWKGREGTAIAEGNVQGRFYRELFEGFCARGEAVVYQLLFNGQVVASDLCLVRNSMMVVLKTAYDESLSDFSPAFLMREEIMRRLFANKQLRVVEFYGRVMDWHMRWTDEVRTLYHVSYYRHSWVRTARQFAKRFS